MPWQRGAWHGAAALTLRHCWCCPCLLIFFFAGWEATLVALGHTLRKLRQWDAAIGCYQQALGLKPGQARWAPGRGAASGCVGPHAGGSPILACIGLCPACCQLLRASFPTVPAPFLPPLLLLLTPVQPGTYSALGYTYHLKGDVDAAIEQYHKARACASLVEPTACASAPRDARKMLLCCCCTTLFRADGEAHGVRRCPLAQAPARWPCNRQAPDPSAACLPFLRTCAGAGPASRRCFHSRDAGRGDGGEQRSLPGHTRPDVKRRSRRSGGGGAAVQARPSPHLAARCAVVRSAGEQQRSRHSCAAGGTQRQQRQQQQQMPTHFVLCMDACQPLDVTTTPGVVGCWAGMGLHLSHPPTQEGMEAS